MKKSINYPISNVLLSCLILSISTLENADAATVTGGALTVNLDRNALIAGVQLDKYPDQPTGDFQICCRPSIYVEEFWDASSASKTFSEVLEDNTPDLYDSKSDEISAVGLQFSVNGQAPINNPAGRQNRNTTFNFDPNDLFGTASGSIGLGGVIRFRVDVDPPSNRVIMGDFTLVYNPDQERVEDGFSGWVLMNNIGFTISGFYLYDVATELDETNLTLSGVLGMGDGFDHLGGITNTRVGTFTFQTAVVPIPSAIWFFVTGFWGLAAKTIRDRATFA